jgi:hypothetical protein
MNSFWLRLGVIAGGYIIMTVITGITFVMGDRKHGAVKDSDVDVNAWLSVMWPIMLPIFTLMIVTEQYGKLLRKVAVPPDKREALKRMERDKNIAEIEADLRTREEISGENNG